VTKLNWTTQAQFIGTYDFKPTGRRLGLVIAADVIGDTFQLVALETSAAATKVEDVFEDHAHKVVDRFDDIPSAFKAAEKYCKEWVKAQKEKAALQKCECEEIS
jgi:hypothetical protein